MYFNSVRPICLHLPKLYQQVAFNLARRQFSSSAVRCKIDLSGIIMPAPTPFENNEKQTVHYDMLRQNIHKWEQIPAGLKGYCIGATNSEGPYLRHEEKLSMIKVYKSQVAKNKLIIAGTSCETTNETCEFSKAAADAGADAVFIMPPYYFKSRMTV